MFFQRLFKNPQVLLTGTLNLSSTSTLILSHKSSDVGDKELILLALLVYARFLRIEAKKEREELLGLFSEFASNFKHEKDKEELLTKMANLIGLLSNSLRVNESTTIKLKKVEKGNTYIDMGVINRIPLSKAVYTTFKYAWDNLAVKENKIRLMQGFVVLGKTYEQEKFTLTSAVEFPNIIVYDTIPF